MWGRALALILLLGACSLAENAREGAGIVIAGERMLLSGVITSRTPAFFAKSLADNPQVTTIVQTYVEGSISDAAMIDIGYRIRRGGLNTHLDSDSEIYSGGVDLFLAGNRRTMVRGAVIGVHSWADGLGEGAEYPRGAPEHRANLRYTTDMLGSDAFYWFTLVAAPSDGIHIMTEAEIEQFGLLTAPARDK